MHLRALKAGFGFLGRHRARGWMLCTAGAGDGVRCDLCRTLTLPRLY